MAYRTILRSSLTSLSSPPSTILRLSLTSLSSPPSTILRSSLTSLSSPPSTILRSSLTSLSSSPSTILRSSLTSLSSPPSLTSLSSQPSLTSLSSPPSLTSLSTRPFSDSSRARIRKLRKDRPYESPSESESESDDAPPRWEEDVLKNIRAAAGEWMKHRPWEMAKSEEYTHRFMFKLEGGELKLNERYWRDHFEHRNSVRYATRRAERFAELNRVRHAKRNFLLGKMKEHEEELRQDVFDRDAKIRISAEIEMHLEELRKLDLSERNDIAHNKALAAILAGTNFLMQRPSEKWKETGYKFGYPDAKIRNYSRSYLWLLNNRRMTIAESMAIRRHKQRLLLDKMKADQEKLRKEREQDFHWDVTDFICAKIEETEEVGEYTVGNYSVGAVREKTERLIGKVKRLFKLKPGGKVGWKPEDMSWKTKPKKLPGLGFADPLFVESKVEETETEIEESEEKIRRFIVEMKKNMGWKPKPEELPGLGFADDIGDEIADDIGDGTFGFTAALNGIDGIDLGANIPQHTISEAVLSMEPGNAYKLLEDLVAVWQSRLDAGNNGLQWIMSKWIIFIIAHHGLYIVDQEKEESRLLKPLQKVMSSGGVAVQHVLQLRLQLVTMQNDKVFNLWEENRKETESDESD